MDSDGDTRGPEQGQEPNAVLFDGNELAMLKTSPTLEDTDGDDWPDFEDAVDIDGDGLSDEEEVRDGWDVVLPGKIYRAYSDPSEADQYGDEVSDFDGKILELIREFQIRIGTGSWTAMICIHSIPHAYSGAWIFQRCDRAEKY